MRWSKNRMTCVAGILFASVYIFMALNIDEPTGMTQDLLGSRNFPLLIGFLILISSIAIFAKKSDSDENDEETFGKSEIIMLFPYVLMIIIYIIFLPILGTIITTFLFLYYTMNRMSKGVWWKNTIITVSIAVILWILFVVILKVQLPTGLLRVI